MSMTKMTVVGNVTTVRKCNVNEEKIAYNFGIAVDDGYGENKSTYFYNATMFSKRGKQEAFLDRTIVVGAKLPCIGVMKPGKSYEKEGVTIHPWVFLVRDIGLGINDVTLSGRLTADATIANGKNDSIIVRFTIAVDGYGERPDFVRVVKFGKGGFSDYAKNYLTKGRKISVFGSIHSGSYTNQDGQTVPTFDVVASELKLWGNDTTNSGNNGEQNNEKSTQNIPQPQMETSTTNDIPPAEAYLPEDDFIDLPEDDDDELPF